MLAKTLRELLIEPAQLVQGSDAAWSIKASGVEADSRRVKAGTLFFALRGLTVDGHDYLEHAVQSGACAVVVERTVSPMVLQHIPCFLVENSARAYALAVSALWEFPSRRMQLIGVTGTNGKTTTTHLIESILQRAGLTVGLIGTITSGVGVSKTASAFTTPTPELLQSLMHTMVSQHASHVVMEVSSHGLELDRLWGCEFSVAAYTQLSQDHLDLHKTMDAYLHAKLRLFRTHLRDGGTAIVNLDGERAQEVIDVVKTRPAVNLVTCSCTCNATVRLDELAFDLSGIRGVLVIDGKRRGTFYSPLVGAYNAENLAVALSSAHALKLSPEHLIDGIAALKGVPGRLERVTDVSTEFSVFVDYAHTPDALNRVITVLRSLSPSSSRVIVVFGCGGDRDRGKRPLMGRAVAERADIAVITSDNPRSEDPRQIIEDILPGVRQTAMAKCDSLLSCSLQRYWVEIDRRHAIAETIHAARPGDVILIAGKGHEDYQWIGKERLHFDDREEARIALARRGAVSEQGPSAP